MGPVKNRWARARESRLGFLPEHVQLRLIQDHDSIHDVRGRLVVVLGILTGARAPGVALQAFCSRSR